MSADGSAVAEPVTIKGRSYYRSWSPDGRFLALQVRPDADDDIVYLERAGDPELHRFLDSPADESYPQISPNSRWLAYYSDESGQGEIYIRSFPDGAERQQVSIGGSSGYGSSWSRDGSEVYYVGGDRLMAVHVETKPRLSVEEPRELFRLPLPVAPTFRVTPAGERFLMIRIGNETDGGRIDLVLNFGEELKRLVPKQ